MVLYGNEPIAMNEFRQGYNLGNEVNITHFLYIDKLYSSTEQSIKKLLRKTDIFRRDIGMEFGLDKCKINNMNKGKWQQIEEYHTDAKHNDVIIKMNREDSCKYLGFQQNQGIDIKIGGRYELIVPLVW